MVLTLRAGLALLLFAAVPLAAQQPTPAPRPQAPPAQRQQPARTDTLAAHAARVDSLQRAQQAALDSLADRVEQAEATVQRLQHQLEEQAQSKIESRLKNRVEFSGLILLNAFYNGAKMNAADAPGWVVRGQDTSGLPNSAIGGVARQTRLGVSVKAGSVLGGDVSGDLQMDFYGNAGQDAGARLISPLRIRTATLRVDWPHLGLMVGQDAPLVSQLNPVSYAESGFPGFWGAGNLWLWIPQARLTVEAGNSFRFGAQVAALDPVETSFEGYLANQPDMGEKSGRPSIEGRVYIGWGDGDNESTIGVGAHRGWIATAEYGTAVSQALTADVRITVGGAVTLVGEAFTGQALAGLGDGGIAQNFGPQDQIVRTRGGWAQLTIHPGQEWELGGGAGIDDPNDVDLLAEGDTLATAARLRNVAFEGHLHWKPGGGLLFGAEFWRFQTSYAAGTISANHVNFIAGIAF